MCLNFRNRQEFSNAPKFFDLKNKSWKNSNKIQQLLFILIIKHPQQTEHLKKWKNIKNQWIIYRLALFWPWLRNFSYPFFRVHQLICIFRSYHWLSNESSILFMLHCRRKGWWWQVNLKVFNNLQIYIFRLGFVSKCFYINWIYGNFHLKKVREFACMKNWHKPYILWYQEGISNMCETIFTFLDAGSLFFWFHV